MTKYKTIIIAVSLAPLIASAITATKEYVDRKDAETYAAATNAVATVSTNFYTKSETEAKIVELAPVPGDYAAVSNAAMSAAVARPSITTTTGGETRTEIGSVVYANVNLMIREVPAANGQKQFRLIRRSE